MGIDVVLLIVFVVMAGAIALDRSWAAGDSAAMPPATPSPAPVPAPVLALPHRVAPTLVLPDLSELAHCSDGWALFGPSGTVVATNLPERAALLAGACAVLRWAQTPDQTGRDWHTVAVEGPSGIVLGEASPGGAVLAVLARRDAPTGELRRAMGHALQEVDRRWAALSIAADLSAAEPTSPGGGEDAPQTTGD